MGREYQQLLYLCTALHHVVIVNQSNEQDIVMELYVPTTMIYGTVAILFGVRQRIAPATWRFVKVPMFPLKSPSLLLLICKMKIYMK